MTLSGQTILEVSDITVSFDGFRALDELSFVMYDDKLTVVIGPNGAGKTTFLDVVTGRTRAQNGSVRFDGRDITGMADYRIARLGMARKFQAPSIFPDLSVFENLRVAASPTKSLWSGLTGRIDADLRSHIEQTAAAIGLQDRLPRKGGALSHGQRQWLEIGMVLASRPRLILLDEPIAGMTLEEIAHTDRLLREISRETPLLVIEHDMGFVRSIADRVCVFHQGRQLTEGSFDRVSNDPRVREIYLGEKAA
jgi:urea transport system ATP-binding protein